MELPQIYAESVYEIKPYIEKYTAKLVKPDFYRYNSTLTFKLMLSKYHKDKPQGRMNYRSIKPLPPHVYFGQTHLCEPDLSWAICFGPYKVRFKDSFQPAWDDISRKLSNMHFHVRDGVLQQLTSGLEAGINQFYCESFGECPEPEYDEDDL